MILLLFQKFGNFTKFNLAIVEPIFRRILDLGGKFKLSTRVSGPFKTRRTEKIVINLSVKN